jgi:hypothetical protein
LEYEPGGDEDNAGHAMSLFESGQNELAGHVVQFSVLL